MNLRRACLALCAAAAIACASTPDDLPHEQAAAWAAAFQAGSAAYAEGRSEEAELRLREALEIARAEQPPGLRTGLCLNGLAALSIDRGRFSEAEPTLRRAIGLLEAAGAGNTLQFAAALTNAGVLAMRQGHPAEAERSFARAERVAKAQSGTAATIILQRSLVGLSESMRAQDRDVEADALTPRIEKLCEKQPSALCASIPR